MWASPTIGIQFCCVLSIGIIRFFLFFKSEFAYNNNVHSLPTRCAQQRTNRCTGCNLCFRPVYGIVAAPCHHSAQLAANGMGIRTRWMNWRNLYCLLAINFPMIYDSHKYHCHCREQDNLPPFLRPFSIALYHTRRNAIWHSEKPDRVRTMEKPCRRRKTVEMLATSIVHACVRVCLCVLIVIINYSRY